MFYLIHLLKYKINNYIELIHIYSFYLILFVMLGLSGSLLQEEHFASSVIILLLFSWLSSFSNFYQEDYEDGTLDQLRLSNYSLEVIMLLKLLVHLLLVCAPMAFITCAVTWLLGFSSINLASLSTVILLTGLQMGAVGALADSLCIGLKKVSNLLSIIIIPLIIPSIIFSLNALHSASSEASSSIILLMAYCALSIPLCCIGSAACLRNSE